MSRIFVSIGALQVLFILVGLARSKVLSGLLGPGGFGVLSTIDQVALTLMHLGALSLPFTAMKFMSRSHSEGSDAFERTYRSFLRVVALVQLAATALATLVAVGWPDWFGADLAAQRVPLQIAILGVPALTLNVLIVNTLAAAQRPSAGAVVNLLTTLALALAAIIGAMLGGLPGLFTASVAAGVLATVAKLVYLHRSLGLRISGPSRSLLSELRASPEIFSYSGYIYLVIIANSLLLLTTRTYVLSHLGAVEAGHLQALISIALTVGFVLAPLSNLYLIPLVNRQIPLSEKLRATHDFSGKLLVLLLLASLPVVLFPRLVLSLLFTAEFAPAAKTLSLFVLWQCLYQLVYIYQQLLIGLDDVRFVSLAACVGFGASALLFPMLVPRWGLGGAASALTLGMLIYGFAASVRLRLRFGSAVPAGILVRIGYVLGTIGLAGWLFAGHTELSLADVSLRALFAAASLAVYWLLLDPGEREFVRTGFGARRNRPTPRA